jgi:hypothetical protein
MYKLIAGILSLRIGFHILLIDMALDLAIAINVRRFAIDPLL